MCLELISLEIFVLGCPAFGLHHLQRVGRCDQYLRQQRIRIERNWRDECIKLRWFEQLLIRCGRRGTRALCHCTEWQEDKKCEHYWPYRLQSHLRLRFVSSPLPFKFAHPRLTRPNGIFEDARSNPAFREKTSH